MKKLLSLMLAVFLAGCTARTPTEQKIRIGVTVYDQYDTFISELISTFNADIAGRENITVDNYSASKNQLTQNKQVQQMINDGCNVICVNLVDRTEPSRIIEAARKAGVPVIFFNRELVEEDLMQWEGLYYIGADAEESGIIQGQIAADIIRNTAADRNEDGLISYIVLEGEAGHQDAIVRTEKSVGTLMEEGIQVEKLGSAIANWNRSQAQTRMAQYIDQFGTDIELVFGNNDDMALGAIDAYKSSRISEENWPVIVGIDGTEPGLKAVIDGDLDGTVYNDSRGQAEAMAALAYALAAGESTENLNLKDGKYIRLPYLRITAENAADYLEQASSQ